jgi:hypothetical protein
MLCMCWRRDPSTGNVILHNKGNNLKHGFRLDLVDYNDPPRPSDTPPLFIREGPGGGSIKRYLNTEELHGGRIPKFIKTFTQYARKRFNNPHIIN